MSSNYLQIRNDYLRRAWLRTPDELQAALPAERDGDSLHFQAFGEECVLSREEVTLSDRPANGPEGLLIAMYASFVQDLPIRIHPLKSFKELPNSMPYQSAFQGNAETVLVPHVPEIRVCLEDVTSVYSGHVNTDATSGDFSFTLYPLPRVPLYYIFHLPDDEFPASVTCLFAANASQFLPLDGLADVAEYTARKMMALLGGPCRGR